MTVNHLFKASTATRLSETICLLLTGLMLLSAPSGIQAKKRAITPATMSLQDKKAEQFVDNLLGKMTLDEKIGQMSQVLLDWSAPNNPLDPNSKGGKDLRAGRVGSMFNVAGADLSRKLQKIAVEETRLHIPLIFGFDVIHGLKTVFPIPLAEACSWDMSAIERSARIAAVEASAMGIHWVFSPMVDVCRDARWGRIAEGAGEDPYLGSMVAKALVKGYQGNSLDSDNTVMACAKHFAAYGACVAGRDYNAVDLSERTLREVYLPPFKAAVSAGAGTLMASFNTVNGVPSSANPFLLRDVLKKEWGFNGFVVSDFESVKELVAHKYAADERDAARLAANAGLDMEMKSDLYARELNSLVKNGAVPEKNIDEAVRRILTVKYRLGLFNDPYRNCSPEREKKEILTPGHLSAARDMARKSIVLLKNDLQTLPLSKDNQTIAVFGALADSHDMLGCWGGLGNQNDVVSILDGIKAAVSSSTKILYTKGCEINSPVDEDFSAALELAAKADKIVVVAGELAGMSGEAQSRANITIPGNQERFIKELIKLGKPVIVLLTNGRPLCIPWLAQHATAILDTWFLGIQTGNAVADVLFGDYNPSGKLTVSFPANIGQLPIFYGELSTGRPLAENTKDPFRSRYTDETNNPVYPFGYGLSYTTFDYSQLKTDKPVMSKNDSLYVSVTVRNTGTCRGEEVVQLYLQDVAASVCRPVKELKRFRKLSFEPGEQKRVTFVLSIDDLKFYDKNMKWTAEPGMFNVYVGGNSRDVLKTSFELN